MSDVEVERVLLRRVIAEVQQARTRMEAPVRWSSPAARVFEARRAALERRLEALGEELGAALRAVFAATGVR